VTGHPFFFEEGWGGSFFRKEEVDLELLIIYCSTRQYLVSSPDFRAASPDF
jgi:hypothetical protein